MTTDALSQDTIPGAGLADLLDAVDVVDPYPLWQSLLASGPVVAPDGSFALLSSHADCDAVLRSTKVSSDRNNSIRWQAVAAQLSDQERQRQSRQRSFLFLDPPDHTRLRRLVSKAFTPRMVERLGTLVEQLTGDLLDAAAQRGHLELVADLAQPLPVAVISQMLGVPPEDHVRFASWSAVLARGLDDTLNPGDPEQVEQRWQAIAEFETFFKELTEQRRACPQDDLLTALVAAEDDGDRLTADELVSTAMLLLIAGHETTVSLISNGMLALLADEQLPQRMSTDPAYAAGVVEEVLRLDPPVQMTMRIPLEDLEVPGGTVHAGGTVVLLLAAAGRDPEQHPDPLRFDPNRKTGHLALSAGPHYCLGASLARLEARIALTALARRLVKPTLGQLTYRENRVLRGPAQLEVRYTHVLPR